MRRKSPENCRSSGKMTAAAASITAAVLLAIFGLVAGGGFSRSAAQDAAADFAFVEAVSGRVIASARTAPTLLDFLDIVSDRTRLDLQADSELRLCHYRTQRLLTLRGPLRAWILADGVTTADGKAVDASAGTCAAPVISGLQGGLVARGIGLETVTVALQPSIRVLDRGTQPIRKVALWDGERRRILMTFDRKAARPLLDDGRSYLLVVERSDGSELKIVLQASAVTRADPLIVVVR